MPEDKYTKDYLSKLLNVNIASPINPAPSMVAQTSSQFDEGFFVPQDAEKQQEALAEHRAENQSTTDKWFNAMPRLISKVGTEVAKTPAYMYALGEAAFTDKSLAQSLDNSWLNYLQNLDDKTKENFAIYKPKSVTEGNLSDNIFSASFWTDEGVDGVGFLLAMMAPAGALRLANLSGKMTKFGVGINTAKNLELGAGTLLNTTLESAAESKGLVDKIKPMLDEQFAEKVANGMDPELAERLKNEMLNKAGFDSFMQNMILIAGPNFLMNKKMLGRFIPDKTSMSAIEDASGKFIAPIKLTNKQIAGNYAKSLLGSSVSEGFIEEGGQFAIENYNEKVALGINDASLIDEYIDGLSTTEGQKSVFLGAFLGSMSAVAEQYGKAAKDFKKETNLYSMMKKNEDAYISSINELYDVNEKGEPQLNPKRTAEYLVAMHKNMTDAELKDDYARLGNEEGYAFIANKDFTRFAASYLMNGGNVDGLNKHIDELSAKLLENEKKSNPDKNDLDEVKFKSDLKQKAKQLEKAIKSIDNSVNVKVKSENKPLLAKFANDLFNTALNETSNQMFIKDRINDLNLKRLELTNALSADIPQNKIEADKIAKQIELYNKDFETSVKDYEKLFDKNEQEIAFAWYEKQDIKTDKDIEKTKKEVVKNEVKDFADRIRNGEDTSSPEDLQFYENNSKEIEKELAKKTDEELTAELFGNPEQEPLEESEIPSSDEINDSEPIVNQDKGFKAKTVAKTNQGFDGIIYRDSNTKDDHSLIGESQETYTLRNFRTKNTIEIPKSEISKFERINKIQNQRVFRWINKNEVKGYRLRIVTKNNNFDLYQEILQDNPDALLYEKNNPNYRGIWTIITDNKNEIVRVDGKLLAMTLETVPRIENDELIVDKKKGKEDIEAIREAAINTTNPNAYFEVTSKSNGIAQFERKENGRRVGRSIIGRIINKFSDAFKLTLATQKGTYINGIPLDLGRLYIEDKDGRVLDLLPRLINESEIDLIMSLLEQEITGNKQIDKPIDEIKKIISFKKTSDPRYQLYISNGELFFGEDSLNKANFEEKIEDLVNFLQSKRVNANSLYINKNIQLPTVDGSGRTIGYAEYLLQGEDPMFGTDLKDKSNIQFLNQYLRYNSTIKFAEDVAEDYGMPTEDDLNNSEIIDSLGGSEIDNKKNQIESIGREINRLVGLRSNDKVVRQAIIDSNNKKITLEELVAIERSWNNANGLTSAFIEILRLRKELEALENKDNIAIESLVNETPIKEKKSVKLKFANVGDILYDTKGNKYEVISKKDKYGRSLEYRLNDKKVGEINPKTVGPYEDSFADEYLFYSKIDALEESNTGQDAPIITQEKNPTPAKKEKKKYERKDENKTDRLRSRTSDKEPIPKKELEWFQYNFPSIPIDKVIGLIQQKSMGRFLSSGRVLLSDKAVAGTLYHEAFHAVTQLYLTKEEVDRLYKEVADRTGITDRFKAEELLAEDFINYKKNGVVLKGAPQRNTLFRKILNAIKDFLGLKASDINEVYRRLDNGFYRNSKVVGLKEFSSLNKDGDKEFVTKEKGTKFLIDTLDGMDLMFFNAILHPDSANKNISNVIFNKFLNLYDAEQNDDLSDSYEFIIDNFEKINSLWKERLVSLGFKFSQDRFDYVEDYEDRGTESLDEKEEQTKEDLKGTKDQNFVNQKDLLTSSSKMLIKSLKRLNYKNDLGLEVPLDYGQTYNYLIKNIAGTGNNFIDIMDKLKSLVKDKPEIQQLVDMLGETGDSISDKQFNLQTAFTKDFNKTRTDSLITVISPNGAIRIIDATKMNDADMVKEIWNNNLISLFPQNEAGNQIIPNVKEFIAVRDNVEFLSKLGIQFNEYTLAYLDENKSELTDSVAAIKNYLISKNGNVNQLFSNKSDLYKRIDSLINLESKYAPYVNELSFFSTEGKTVYSVGENNGLSRTINEINKSKTLIELQKRLPHLDTVTVRNSQYIKSLFDENGVKKPGAEIKLYLQDGIKSSSDAENQVKQSTRKSTIGDLMVQQFNSLLQKGISSFIVSADKSSEFGIGLSLKEGNLVIPIEYVEDNFNSPKIKEIFRGYFKDELNRIALFVLDGVGNNIDYYRKEADNFTIFQDIVPAETRKKIIEKLNEFKNQGKSYIDAKADIEKLLDNNFSVVNNKTVEFFENYEKEITNLAKKYNLLVGDKFYGVTDDLKAEFDINENVLKKNNKHTNQALIRAIAINSYINNVEQTKLFTGDLAFYKAIYKRSAAHAGTKEMPRVDDAINSYLTKNFPRRDGKVQDGMENVVVFDNVETQKLELDEYLAEFEKKGTKREDALKILGFTKNDIEKINKKEPIEKSKGKAYAKMDEGDAMGWCTIDFYREFMKRLANWSDAQENAYQNMQDGIPLTNKEIQLFQQLKLQYAGPQEIVGGLFAPAYHKFTVLPLLPELVKGKNISKTLENMVKNDIGYALFGSGSKVGSITNANGELTKFYTGKNNGEINSEGYNIQRVYYNYLGLQQKPSKPHDTAVFSTQFRKTPWIGSFQNGEELVKGAKKRFDTFSSLINEKIQATKDELLIELGIRPGDNTYTSTNVENLVTLLQKEAKERNLPSNMIESIDFKIEEGKQILKTKFDAVVNKDKITSMLMSLIDSRIIRQQFNGDAYVLSSVAGFETLGERELGPNKALRGYTIDPITGNTLPAEVMIPMSKNYYPLFKMYGNDLSKLNEAIRNKDPKIDPRVLELIGCRIPGQGQNSNEYLTVKEFLPEASATTMIAHPEIVAKAGSDFDNDKLFTYRVKINKDGTYDESDINNKIVTVLKDQISAKENFTMLVTPNSTSIIDDFVDKLKYLKYKNKTILKNKTAEKPARIMDEEEYLKTLDQKGVKYSNLLKITEQIEARYKLWLAKDEVGPVAISNAYGPIAQAANLTANQFFFRTTVKNGIEVRERVSVNIRLKHNKVDDKINLASFFDAEEKNPITQVNEQLINIVVDAANETEPSVAYLNMLMETLPVYLYLNRAGVEFGTVGSFMAQPIMSSYLMYKGISNSALSKVISIDGESNAIKKAKKPYINYLLKNVGELKGKEENIPAFLAENQKDQLDKSDLMEYLEVENQEGIEYAITQLQVLDDYSEYREQARMLNEAVRTTNHDSAGTGQSLISVEEKKILERKVASDGFINGLERVKETFLGPFNQDDLALKAYNPFFYTKEDPIIRNNTLYLLQEVKNNNYTFGKDDVVKTGNLIENDFINFIVQNYGYENPAQRMNELFAGENSIAKRVLALKNRARELNKPKSELSSKELEEKEIADNILITQLYPLLKTEKKSVDNIKLFNKKIDTYTSDQLTEAFEQLMSLDPELTKDIIDLGILQSGLNNSPITFLGIIPNSYYSEVVNKGFDKFSELSNKDEIVKQFNQLFLRNNVKDGFIGKVAYVKGVSKEPLGNGMFGKNFLMKNYMPSMSESKKESVTNQKGIKRLFVEMSNVITDFEPEVQKLFMEPTVELYETAIGNYEYDLSADISDEIKKDRESKLQDVRNSFEIINSTQTSTSAPVADIPQNKVSGIESFGSTVTANAEAIKALGTNPHSIDMIEAGFRTRTTRSETEMAKYAVKVGDTIKHFGKSANGTTKNILARVTAIHPKGTPGFKGTWNKEGWRAADVNVIDRFKDGAAAIEFEIIEPSTNVKKGIEISSSSKGLAAALTNPTELAKSKGNLTQSYPVQLDSLIGVNKKGINSTTGVAEDAESAYQALKDNSESKTKPAIEDSNNYSLMVDIIKAKLEQHPRLVNEIKKQGGSDWILSATHQPTAQNSVWETGGQNWFIKALNEAYLSTGSNFKTKIDQFNYTYNPNTGEVIHNSKTGEKVETNETQINKVLVQYALENGYEIKAFNNSEYIKINNKILNISNGNLVTQKQILDLFQNTEEVTNLDLETEKPLSKNEFTYKGKTIETEFKLGNDQEKALKELADFVTDSKETVITLQGAAGTGKTSVIGYLQKYIGKKFAYMAPTHAATAELAFATVKTGNTDLPSTIQSSLAYNAKEKTWKFSIKVQRRLGFRPTIVVDESSMIDDTDINKLKEAINDVGGKLILMGDEKQISKVIKGNNQTKKVSSAFTDYKQVNLNEIFRQKDADLLDLLSKMRSQTDFKLFKTENSENVKFLGKKEYMDELVSDLMLNPEGTVVVSYTNASVSSINTIAREILGRTGETKVGDIVVGYLGYASKQIEKADIANSVQYKIDSIIENGSVRQINVSSKKLENLINLGINNIKKDAFTNYYQLSNDDSLTFDNLSSEDFAKNNEEVSRVFRAIHKASLDYKNNRINYASYLSILAGINETLRKYSVGNDYIYNPETDSMEKYDERKHASLPQTGQGSLKFDKDIDYGHAITIHKSQGSTIDNVYFDASSLSSARNTPIIDKNGVQITTEKQSLAYVAMSRSKNKLVVYEGAEEFEMINPKKTNNISKSEENNVPLTSEDDIILDTLGEDTRDSLITKMKEIFYSNKGFFNENGITDESQIEKLTETQLGELLIKFCK